MYEIPVISSQPRRPHKEGHKIGWKVALIAAALLSSYFLTSCTSAGEQQPPQIAVPTVVSTTALQESPDVIPSSVNHYEYHSPTNVIPIYNGGYTQDGQSCNEINGASDEKELYYKDACKAASEMASIFQADEATKQHMDRFVQGLKILDLDTIKTLCSSPEATGCTSLENTFIAQEHFNLHIDSHIKAVFWHEMAHDLQNQESNPDIVISTPQYRLDKNNDGLVIIDSTGTTHYISRELFPTLTQVATMYISDPLHLQSGDVPYGEDQSEVYQIINIAKGITNYTVLNNLKLSNILNPFESQSSMEGYLVALGSGNIDEGINILIKTNLIFE